MNVEHSHAAWSRRAVLSGLAATPLIGCGPQGDRGGKAADVIVIGAGLSGLYAAWTLAREGVDVLVVEASDRIGGRMFTLDDVPGAPEAGGAQVGQTYARVRYAASEMGLEFGGFPPSTFGQTLFVNNELLPAADWTDTAANTLPAPLRETSPARLFFRLAAQGNPFMTDSDWLAVGSGDRDAEAHVRSLGADDEAVRLMNVSLNANQLDSYSIVNVWRSLVIFGRERGLGGSERMTGGSQRLPERLAEALPRGVRLNTPVSGIAADGAGGAVRLATGETLRADMVVCAASFPAVRRMAVEAPLSGPQRDAIAGLPYTQITQVFFSAETPYWEADGLAADMWTDGPLERVFSHGDAAGAPTGVFTAWMDGIGSRAVAELNDDAVAAVVSAEMARARPASEGRIAVHKVVRWTDQSSLFGGAYMHWAPGQIAKWAEPMVEPAGRLVFAGEHCSRLHTGMEGAAEAGEVATRHVFAALGR